MKTPDNLIALVANTGWYLYNFRRDLATQLQASGQHVLFICPKDKYSQKLMEEGFSWKEWRVGRRSNNPFTEALAVWRLQRLYQQFKPKMVHHHTIKAVLYGTLAAKMEGGISIVNSITSRGYVFSSSSLKARCLKLLIAFLYKRILRAGATIFENPDDQKYFETERFVEKDKTFLIAGVGVDLTKFKYMPEPEGVPNLLFASRFLRDKGLDTFIAAIRVLRKMQIGFSVELAGMPDMGNPSSFSEDDVQTWLKEGIIQKTTWSTDMPHTLSQANILVLPSIAEGIPTILIEGAATGRAIITTDAPGCRNAIIDGITGILVPVKNPEALAVAMLKLLNNPELRNTMGKAGLAFVAGRFDKQTINKATMAVYTKTTQHSI